MIKPQAGDYIHKEDIESKQVLDAVLDLMEAEDIEIAGGRKQHVLNYRNGVPYLFISSNSVLLWINAIREGSMTRRIYPRDLLGNDTTEGHPRAELLEEIAQEAKVNAEFWKVFEFTHNKFHGAQWFPVSGPFILYELALDSNHHVRRKPRTVHIEGEVPEDVIEETKRYVTFYDAGEYRWDPLCYKLAKALLRAAGEDDD